MNATFLLSGAPTITEEPVDMLVEAGSTVVLNCQAEGEPTPTIEWSQQGRPLLGNDSFSILPNGSLRISSVQKEDTAQYECVARNLIGSVLVRVTLTVQGQLYTLPLVTNEEKYFKNWLLKTTTLHLFSSSWRILGVGRVGSLQCVLWYRSTEEAETV